jgi:threonine dehydrogenase-like Zn-dependent dehydrogenase
VSSAIMAFVSHIFLVESMQVCALLGGGGYAEKVNVPAGQVLPIPKGVSLRDAAGFPEVSCTVWSTIFMMVHLKKGESVLVHKPPNQLNFMDLFGVLPYLF